MDFTLTAYFAEILYSSLTKYRSDGYHDTAALLFMFLLFQKLIVTLLRFVFPSIIICHIQHASFRQQFMFRSSGPGKLIFIQSVWFSLSLFVVIGNAESPAFGFQLSYCQKSSVLFCFPW